MQLVWAADDQAGIIRQTGAWAVPEKRKNTRRKNETPYMGCQSKNLIVKQTYNSHDSGMQPHSRQAVADPVGIGRNITAVEMDLHSGNIIPNILTISVSSIREIIRGNQGKSPRWNLSGSAPDISQVTVHRIMEKSGEILKLSGGRYTVYIWNRKELKNSFDAGGSYAYNN